MLKNGLNELNEYTRIWRREIMYLYTAVDCMHDMQVLMSEANADFGVYRSAMFHVFEPASPARRAS